MDAELEFPKLYCTIVQRLLLIVHFEIYFVPLEVSLIVFPTGTAPLGMEVKSIVIDSVWPLFPTELHL